MIVAGWVCIWWVVVRVAALDGRWREERKEHGASGSGLPSPAGRLFLETPFLLAGWIRLDLAVILVYGRPLDLY